MGGFHGVQIACLKCKGREVPVPTIFRTGDAVHFHFMVNLALWHDCLKGYPAGSTGSVSGTLNIECCKPLSTRVRLHPGSVCLDMFVNGLTVTCLSRWFHMALCLFRGRTHSLATLVTAASRKMVLARMMQKWRVV